jgi:hypothetical protein
MAGDAARKRELREQAQHALGIARQVGEPFAVGPLKPGIRHHARTAVAWAANIDDVEIVFLNEAIRVGVNEI